MSEPYLVKMESGDVFYEKTEEQPSRFTETYKAAYGPKGLMKLADLVCKEQEILYLGPPIFLFSPRGELRPLLMRTKGWVSNIRPIRKQDDKPSFDYSVEIETGEILPFK